MHISAVPVDQILARNGVNRGVFRVAGVGIVGAVGQSVGFAGGNFTDRIVAAGDAVIFCFFREFDFVGAKFGIAKNFDKNFKDIFEIALEARPANTCDVG